MEELESVGVIDQVEQFDTDLSVLNNESDGTMFASVISERDSLKSENETLKEKMKGMVEMKLAYQNYIPAPPLSQTQWYGQACANDGITVTSWMEEWLRNMEANSKYEWQADSAYNEYAKSAYMPVIIAGSGPSLKKNAHLLAKRPKQIKLVSCLHNFGYFEDLGVKADYYLNLDAGDVTIPEMSQGGKQDAESYLEASKDSVLVTATHANPKLHDMWRGEKRWFRTIIPHAEAMQRAEDMSNGFDMFFQVGGNTLGACLYFARAVLGGCPIVYVGADFAFGYDHKFHPFDTPYDKQFSGVIPATDCYGNRVYTWQSYFNFKCWMDHIACGGQGNNPGMVINCTEGGICGAYNEGNIQQVQQMPLEVFLKIYDLHKFLPECKEKKMLLF
jgi:hypothetical protein